MRRLWRLLFHWHQFPIPVLPPSAAVDVLLTRGRMMWKSQTPRDALRMWLAERRDS